MHWSQVKSFGNWSSISYVLGSSPGTVKLVSPEAKFKGWLWSQLDLVKQIVHKRIIKVGTNYLSKQSCVGSWLTLLLGQIINVKWPLWLAVIWIWTFMTCPGWYSRTMTPLANLPFGASCCLGLASKGSPHYKLGNSQKIKCIIIEFWLTIPHFPPISFHWC